MLKERVITAIVMLIVFAGMIFFASERVWFAGVGLLMAWAAAEWANLAKVPQIPKALYVMLMPVLLGLLWIAFAHRYQQWIFSAVMFAAVAFWLLVVPLWLYFGWKVSNRLFLLLCGWLALLPAGLCFLYIRQSPQEGWFLLGLLAVVWIADITAYFTGRALGKHKLVPSISPGKTIEGALGAWLGVTLYLVVMVLWLKPDGFADLRISLLEVLVIALFLTYQSIIGDLFESWLKRCAGVKDSGTSLPGHGGILDRIDAILPVLPLQIILLSWLSMHRG